MKQNKTKNTHSVRLVSMQRQAFASCRCCCAVETSICLLSLRDHNVQLLGDCSAP